MYVGSATCLDALLAREFGREVEWGSPEAVESVVLIVIVPREFF